MQYPMNKKPKIKIISIPLAVSNERINNDMIITVGKAAKNTGILFIQFLLFIKL